MLRRESECVRDGGKESQKSDGDTAQALRWSKCQQRSKDRRSIGLLLCMSLKLSGILAGLPSAARNGEACDESIGMQNNFMRAYAVFV